MKYYEIFETRGVWQVWQWTNNGAQCDLFKVFKTRKGAENWARKQWCKVTWR